ncbi:GIY-YIG nuclease family protein [Candidatus Saccharibacteria bacterium]|nr:MAG: GIY-YIG nuclease family protein [Candidatus Saccharibacteria bacterium]
MDLSDDLVKLFESGDGHMFVPPKKQAPVTADDRLAASFQQITDFVKNNDRLPEIESNDISEASLAARLNSIRTDKTKAEALTLIDELGLLEVPEAPKSVDELFESDAFGLFSSTGDQIFKMKEALSKPRPVKERAARKRAEDFDSFKEGFEEQQRLLGEGKLKLQRYVSVEQLHLGKYYVHAGQMLRIIDATDKKRVYDRNKERFRVIYENGSESNMYRRSLSMRLYEDGYAVVPAHEDSVYQRLTDDDEIKGYIYILRSQSADPAVQNVKDLHKIGFTSTTIVDRIKDAEKDPTYLMAGVEVVDSYVLTGDYNPQKVEHFIHRIFSDAKVDLTIIGPDGREYVPSEWYSVPLLAIEQAVNMLQNGDIVDYHYSKDAQQIVANEEKA